MKEKFVMELREERKKREERSGEQESGIGKKAR